MQTVMTITLGQVHYNASLGGFEARVDVRRQGTTFRYPCLVRAPQSADLSWVSDALRNHALSLSDSPRETVH